MGCGGDARRSAVGARGGGGRGRGEGWANGVRGGNKNLFQTSHRYRNMCCKQKFTTLFDLYRLLVENNISV